MKKQSRRNFIATTGLASAGAMGMMSCAPTPPKEDQKMKSNPAIVGHGDFKYEVDQAWGNQDPIKIPVYNCHEMVQDKKGRLILCNTDVRNNIIVYDRSGKVLETWGKEYPGIHGLTIHDEGDKEYLYLTDTERHQVYKTDLKGKVIFTLDYPKESGLYKSASEFVPTETAISPNGELLVADGYGLDYVHRYDMAGKYLGSFAGKGDTPDKVANAHGVCIDNRNGQSSILVSSRATQSIKRYSLGGEYMETIEIPGCWVCRPVIKGDNLYCAVIVTKDWGNYDGMVVVLDKDNKVVSFPGGSAPSYTDGKLEAPTWDGNTFLNPHDVCIDQDENIYVPQWMSGRTYPVKLKRV